MSNIYAFIIASSTAAKNFCSCQNDWFLRSLRASGAVDGSKNRTLEIEQKTGCFAITTTHVDQLMLRLLLRLIMDESFDSFPYPPRTYEQEISVEKLVAREIPYVFGEGSAEPPWAWAIPKQIVDSLSKIEDSKAISRLAEAWWNCFDRDTAAWQSVTILENLLTDLQSASKEATRTKQKVFLYCST